MRRWTDLRAHPWRWSSPARPGWPWSTHRPIRRSCCGPRRAWARAARNPPRSAPARPGTPAPGPTPPRPAAEVFAPQRQIDLVEHPLERDVGGLVDDQPERAAFAVLAQVNDTARESGIFQTRHRDQEMMRQIDGR